ncbi:MAG: alkene reductase [Thiothrix sp.]|nr:MAG: alkene reductase [Thiothrix sp.]
MQLLEPLKLGQLTLKNRVLMAPLTRTRAGMEHMPNALMAEYYAQRASAGLIISECTMILPNTSAFIAEPGVYSAEQVAAWKQVTSAVHAKGGKIFLQIWHAGRAAHPNMSNGQQPIAPSAIAIEGETHTPQGKAAYVVPRALGIDEIPGIVAAYAKAARSAIEAGFDGVEVHGANGYLIDQFLRDGSNKRTDNYGGSIENRARFLSEVLTAVCDAIGSERVGLRLSLLNSYNSMLDSNPAALADYLAEHLNSFNLAYVHVMRADFFGVQKGDALTPFRTKYQGVVISNMGYTPDEAEQAIADAKVDAVAFGTSFLANPDLPERIRLGASLNVPNPNTFYTPGPEGYTDYPFLEK